MESYILKTSEIILKGKNRKYFEKILIENLKNKLKDNLISIQNLGGEFLVETENDLLDKLKTILGISKIVKVEKLENLEDVINFLKKYDSIKLKVKRADKDYPLTSKEIYERIKKELKEKIDKKGRELILEYRKGIFYAGEAHRGFGGLPVGSSGKGIVLLSTGFDSPVASFLMMKRGLKLYFLHFHSYPQISIEDIEKAKDLVKILNEYNIGSILYLINILEIQKFYFSNIPSKYLVIFYRRTMFRLASRLAKELNCGCIITGENLGQVASQTLENMKTIENATNLLVLRPLIGFNKEEIISLAEIIGTKRISEKPGEDCCSLFIPKSPATKAKLSEILEIEDKIKEKLFELEDFAFENKEKIVYH